MTKEIPDKLKPYVSVLRSVHATDGNFSSPKTREIGEEIYTTYGHEAMVWVHEIIRDQIGLGEMRDLEYVWDDIGEWRENGGESIGNATVSRFKLSLLLNR